jgi:Icc-related predicted phosphoesterase
MNILFTADLHLLGATEAHTLSKAKHWITAHQPDAFVVAGDLSSAHQAEETLRSLRDCFPNGPIAVCLGNHDFWLRNPVRQECGSLPEVIDRFWVPAAKASDVILLDNENLSLSDVAIIGAYGHYDFGFAIPGLAYDGIPVTEEDYLRGGLDSVSTMRWNDFQFMPNGRHPREIAADQVAGVRQRLAEVSHNQTIVVLHTPPLEALLGVPPLARKLLDRSPSIYAFFRAYLGNRAMGDFLQEVRTTLTAVVCGHTHRPAGPLRLNGSGTIGINVGSDYGAPKAALYRCDAREFERLAD